MAPSGDLPHKRRHVEDPILTADPSDDAELIDSIDPRTLTHRQTLRGRATLANAADNIHFSNHHALVFNFMDVFDILTDDVGKLTLCTLKCGICRSGSGWSWGKGGKGKGSTTNLRNHMHNKHPLIWENAQQADWVALGKPVATEDTSIHPMESQPMLPEFNIDEWYRLLTRWIVTGNHPFTEVENEEFQQFMVYTKPALEGHIVKSQAIRDRVFSHAATLRESTKKYLRSLSGLMAISCDAWTSSNRIAFLAIMGSWITDDWHLEETLLDFVELRGAHDGQNMATAVASTLTELGIDNKLLALVTDNASTNGTLIRHLSSSLGQSSNRRWDPEKGQIRCLAHVIHLAVMSLLRGIGAVPPSTNFRDFDPDDHSLTVEDAEDFVASDNKEALESDDSEEVDLLVNLVSAIDKIRKISKLVRSSPQRMEFFRAAATQIEEGHEQKAIATNRIYIKRRVKTLILDVITRWNSMYFMLERALEFYEAIDYLTGHAKVAIYRPYALSRDEWAAVSLVCKWLQFFRSAYTVVAAEKYPTLSFSLRVYFLLISYVMDLEKSPGLRQFPSLSLGVAACKEKLLEYFDKATYDSEYYYFATILDPRFKDSLFKSHKGLTAKLFSRDWINGCAKSLRETGDEFYNTQGSLNESSSAPPSSMQSNDASLDEFSRAWKAQLSLTSRSRHSAIQPDSTASEILQYLDEEVTTLSPLIWWRLNASRFPRLAAMARDFLCIPGTSVAVERVFNVGRDVISLRRASLNAETIRTLMTYRAGIALEKQVARSHNGIDF